MVRAVAVLALASMFPVWIVCDRIGHQRGLVGEMARRKSDQVGAFCSRDPRSFNLCWWSQMVLCPVGQKHESTPVLGTFTVTPDNPPGRPDKRASR